MIKNKDKIKCGPDTFTSEYPPFKEGRNIPECSSPLLTKIEDMEYHINLIDFIQIKTKKDASRIYLTRLSLMAPHLSNGILP